MNSAEGTSTRHRLGYQPALDGLRGLAVFAVLAYHGGVRAAGGGFLGVDVFFVLSGYLITALLVQEWRRSGRIDLRAFWVRRVKRLMPALVVLLGAMTGWLFVVAEQAQRGGLRADMVATLGYVANWRFVVSGQSYFAQFADPSPLRHTWSLAVEEQWYLMWPLLVWVGLRVTRGRLGRMALLATLGALASAVWAAVLWGNGDLSRIYYGTDTRAQELLLGAGLALLLAKVAPAPRLRRLFDFMGFLALGGLAAAMVLVHDSTSWLYQGGMLGISLLVAMVIVAGVQPGRGAVKATLSWLPFRSLGKISYGLYLWHWPVNILLTSEVTGLDSWALWGVRLEASLMLALVSYFLVEQPAMRLVRRSRPQVRGRATHWSFGVLRAAVASGAMAVVAALVVVVQTPAGPGNTPGGLPSEAAIGSTLSTMLVGSPMRSSRSSSASSPVTTIATRASASGAATPGPVTEHIKVLVAGDSVAFTLGFGFSPQAIDPNLSIGVTAILGCGVVPGQPYVDGHPHPLSFAQCDGWEETWRQGVHDTRPDVVVTLLGAWEVLDREVDGRVLRVGTPEYAAYLEAQLTKAFDIVTADGTPMVLLTAPCYRETEARLGGPDSDRNDPFRGMWFNTIALGVAKRYGSLVKPIDFGEYLCPDGEPREKINGVTMRYDGVHFTAEGGAEVWRWLVPQVRRAVKTQIRAG